MATEQDRLRLAAAVEKERREWDEECKSEFLTEARQRLRWLLEPEPPDHEVSGLSVFWGPDA